MCNYNIEKITNALGIQMLPAYEGDCILVQLEDDNKVFRLIIDCGPPKTWNSILKDLFNYYYENDIKIDLLVITHIDFDHIGGAIHLFNDNTSASVIKEIWFNGLKQIIGTAEELPTKDNLRAYNSLLSNKGVNYNEIKDDISVKQAQSLSKLLKQKTYL